MIREIMKAEKNSYGDLMVDFAETIEKVLPEIIVETSEPGPWGHDSEISLDKNSNGYTLVVPDGKYRSNKHFHTAGHSILALETGRKKLNCSPLFLVSGRAWNGDYKALKKTYYLLGKNEDSSVFLHRVRPSAAEDGNLDAVRTWMWNVKDGEKLVDRQGDLGFITSKNIRLKGEKIEGNKIQIGNHTVTADVLMSRNGRFFAENPRCEHGEHHAVNLTGIYELRLARSWSNGFIRTKGD